MSLINCSFFSEVLGFQTEMTVILPDKSFEARDNEKLKQEKYPVLYLLHGLMNDHSTWYTKTSIERYAAQYNLAVVMPSVHRSFYADMANGYRYWTFISEELPYLINSMFLISEKRDDTFVAGVSMGGYGAFKLALSQPNRFNAAASLSGSLDISTMPSRLSDYETKLIFSDPDNLKGTRNDIFQLAKEVSLSSGQKPRLYQWCGQQDFLYKDNVSFHEYCEGLNLELTYEEESGDHDWGYWDLKIKRVLEWFFSDME